MSPNITRYALLFLISLKLDLSDNDCGDKGILPFVKALSSSKLRYLYLRGNKLSSKAGQALAEYLAEPGCTLEVLDLSDNDLNKKISKAICAGLKDNKDLKKLMLSGNQVDTYTLESLEECMILLLIIHHV